MYLEADLAKLQNIVALKFFGFELGQIKEIIKNILGTKFKSNRGVQYGSKEDTDEIAKLSHISQKSCLII